MVHRCEVVIATRNRSERLGRCLANLARQTERDLGVVVVDDAGDAPLDGVVAHAVAEGLDVTLLTLGQPSGPAAARNAGTALVEAEFVLFVDDDVCAHPDLVATHLEAVSDRAPGRSPVVSCGPFVEPRDWSPTPWNKWEAIHARREAEAILRGDYGITWRQCHTGNNCMPTSLFRAVGGFDESFKRAEDDELAFRLEEQGCEFRFLAGAIAWHHAERSLEAWLAIPEAYGIYDVALDRRHPSSGHLAARKEELRRRRPELRAARWFLGRTGLVDVGVSMWVGVARRTYDTPFQRLSMGALSAAFDLRYVDALRRAERSPELPIPASSGAG
jgi:GT2 family glycosyltransferase